jgi:hypothetical protein
VLLAVGERLIGVRVPLVGIGRGLVDIGLGLIEVGRRLVGVLGHPVLRIALAVLRVAIGRRLDGDRHACPPFICAGLLTRFGPTLPTAARISSVPWRRESKTSGSNWVPRPSSIISIASSRRKAGR